MMMRVGGVCTPGSGSFLQILKLRTQELNGNIFMDIGTHAPIITTSSEKSFVQHKPNYTVASAHLYR